VLEETGRICRITEPNAYGNRAIVIQSVDDRTLTLRVTTVLDDPLRGLSYGVGVNVQIVETLNLGGGERPPTKQSNKLRIDICAHSPPQLSASWPPDSPLKEDERGFQYPTTPDVVTINVGFGDWRPSSDVS
jgi:hypothetical protein